MKRSRHLAALLAYAALIVALTWPLILSLGALVPDDLGDPLLTASILWWNAQQLPFTEAWWAGTFFFPLTDSLALSDHRVGLGLFATPLIWMGASPLTVYGITFLLIWWLCAAAAYALVWTLTANHAAAFIGGLIFGFNPFRGGHLAHLELLAAYCLPLILVALHQWLATRRGVWLLGMSAALLLQALTSGYYFAFMAVFIGLWLLWFGRGLAAREYATLALAVVAPVVAMAPVLLHYRQAHQAMGLSRSMTEIKQFSADLVGLVTAPERVGLWSAPASWHRPEGDIMPGLTAVLLVVAAAVIARRPFTVMQMPTVVTWLRRGLLVIAITEVVVAVIPSLAGAVAFSFAGITVSMSGIDKPLSVAFLTATAWLLTTQRMVAAFAARSRFAFYCLATAVMFVLALGPEGRLLDRPVIYKAPYTWLMWLPGFDQSFRAPARFAMLAILGLSVAAALAFVRLTARASHRTRVIATAAVAVAIVAESWIYPFPLTPAPSAIELPAHVPPSAVVMALPTGIYEDALAMFDTTVHHRRTVNGMSGYSPPHYQILTQALYEGDDEPLAVLRRDADVVIVRHRDRDQPTFTLLEKQPVREPAASLAAVRPGAITTYPPISSPQLVADDDLRTAWLTATPQTGTEVMTLELTEARAVAGIEIRLGPHVGAYARGIAVDVSSDGREWRTVATASGAAAAFEAALRDARVIAVTIRFTPQHASHVRMRQTGTSKADLAVAEVRVLVPVE